MKRKIIIALLILIAVLAAVLAQQPGGSADTIKARAAADLAYQGAWTTKPGGTPEENLWQVLVLMGVGDREPASWNGSLNINSGELHDIQGYRFELPDRVLPQGGWRVPGRVQARARLSKPAGCISAADPPAHRIVVPRRPG